MIDEILKLNAGKIQASFNAVGGRTVKYDRKVIDQLLSLPKINPAEQAIGDDWIAQAEGLINQQNRLGVDWKVYYEAETESLVFEKNGNGLIEKTTLTHMFFLSNDYHQMMEIAEQNQDMLQGDAVLSKGDNTIEINSLSDVLEYLLSIAKKGLTISRFKGLGEISPNEFVHFIGDDIRLDPVMLDKEMSIDQMLQFYMGKNTPDRQKFIIENLKVELDMVE